MVIISVISGLGKKVVCLAQRLIRLTFRNVLRNIVGKRNSMQGFVATSFVSRVAMCILLVSHFNPFLPSLLHHLQIHYPKRELLHSVFAAVESSTVLPDCHSTGKRRNNPTAKGRPCCLHLSLGLVVAVSEISDDFEV